MIAAPQFGIKRATRAQQTLMRLFLQHVETLSRPLERDLSKIWSKLGLDAEASFRAMAKSKAAIEGSVGSAAAIESSAYRDSELILASLDMARVSDNLRTLIQRQHVRVMTSTVNTINATFDMGVNLPDPVARRIVQEGGKRIGLIDFQGDTRRALFRSLLDGRILGEGQDDLARRIRSQVPAGRFVNAGPAYRSKLIARTETKWAQNQSAMAAYAEAGATHVLAFDAQGRGDSDPECEARNGQTFLLEEADAELDSEHPNGTLSFAPVFNPGEGGS